MKELSIEKEIFVDASAASNPGAFEYRGVDERRNVLFSGAFPYGTNNIGEYLAIYKGVEYLKREHGGKGIIWTDSQVALSWVRRKFVRTTIERNELTENLFLELEKAVEYLNNSMNGIQILFWETKAHGDIPADYGRKGNYIYGIRKAG